MGDMEIVMAMLQGLFIFFFIAGLTCLLSKRLGRRMGRGRCSRYMESQDRLVSRLPLFQLNHVIVL